MNLELNPGHTEHIVACSVFPLMYKQRPTSTLNETKSILKVSFCPDVDTFY